MVIPKECIIGKKLNEDFCLELFEGIANRMKWYEANNFCTQKFGNEAKLLEIYSLDEINTLVRMYKNGANIKKIWLGFSDENRPKNNFVTASNSSQEMTFNNFQNGRPSKIGQFNCVVMDMKNGMWFDETCHNRINFGCMIPRFK